MSITAITRDFGSNPSIVRITTTNTLAEITTQGYLSNPIQLEAIRNVNYGDFQWVNGDLVAIHYDGGSGFFRYDVANATFKAVSPMVFSAGQLTSVGGAAAEDFAIPGALATDLVFVNLVDDGPNDVTILTASVALDEVTVTFSGNPGAGAIANYQLLRLG